ncbi:unnamed protein product [Ceutorhynchus assimilis]|uniref:YqaJ viral recombinase domain-containing protein n=1 Tax=Ceutorhynchus assimilis TaxID=467358 RepID=A0A9N9MP58_9CUCU|nr:unnamed protein product [Ceutorhynchus assimilis]
MGFVEEEQPPGDIFSEDSDTSDGLNDVECDEINEDLHTLNIHQIVEAASHKVPLCINGVSVNFEVDTGACKTVMSSEQFHKILGYPLNPVLYKLRAVSGRKSRLVLLDHLREERTNVLDEPVPSTSQPRTWSTGSDRQVVKKQFHDLKFNKPDPKKPNKRTAALQECRTTFNRQHLENNLSPFIIKQFSESLEKNNLTMFSEVLASHNYEPISIKLPNNQSNKNECDNLKRPEELPLPLKINWIWCQEYLKVIFRDSLPNIDFINNVSLSLDDCRFLEAETRNQSSSSRWHLERKKRISASKFGAIIERTIPVTIQLISRIWPKGTGFKSAMMQQGLINETAAVSKYKDLYPNVDVFTCGLCVNPGIPFLAASPNSLLYNPDEKTMNLLEIKTLVKSGLLENQKVLEDFSKGSVPYLELMNGNLQLRRNHDFSFR